MIKFVPSVIEYIGSLEDDQFLNNVITEFQPEIVYHLAANKNRARSKEYLEDLINVNLMGSYNLFKNLCGLNSLRKVIALGTIDEYGINCNVFSETTVAPLTLHMD